MNYTNKQDISDVILAYATAIDTRDWALFKTCFSDTLIADYGTFGFWNSLSEFAQFMEEIHRDLGDTMHRISNIVVALEEGSAQAKSYVDAVLMPGKPGGQLHRAIGYYQDELSVIDGRWKITRRVFSPVYSSVNGDF